jgi:lysozyme
MDNHITKISPKALDAIKRLEGFSATPYADSCGIWTIGYGATYYEGGKKVTSHDGSITKERAEQLLLTHLKSFEMSVDSFTRDDVSQAQFDALVLFAYNVGVGALKSSTLLKMVNENPNNPEIKSQFMRWNKGKVDGELVEIKGLTNRRQAEANIYFNLA